MTAVREAQFTIPTKVSELLPGDVVRLTGGFWTYETNVTIERVAPAEDRAFFLYADGDRGLVEDVSFPFEFVSRPGVYPVAAVTREYLHTEPVETFRGVATDEAIAEAFERARTAVQRTQREWPWGKTLAYDRYKEDGNGRETIRVYWKEDV